MTENNKFAELDKVQQLLAEMEFADLMVPIRVGQQILQIINDLHHDKEQFGGQLLLPSPDEKYNFVIRIFREEEMEKDG